VSLSLLERVMHLVRLAGSDNENEARNAAMEATRLIREHGMTIALTPASVVRTSPPGRPIVSKEGIGEKTARVAREILERAAHPGADIRWPVKEPSSDTVLRRPRPVVMANAISTTVKITSKFAGNCEDCRRPFGQGSGVWYRRGVGCVHEACDPGALV
jgi:hypothetical protein